MINANDDHLVNHNAFLHSDHDRLHRLAPNDYVARCLDEFHARYGCLYDHSGRTGTTAAAAAPAATVDHPAG